MKRTLTPRIASSPHGYTNLEQCSDIDGLASANGGIIYSGNIGIGTS
jgi:hypothetical protein